MEVNVLFVCVCVGVCVGVGVCVSVRVCVLSQYRDYFENVCLFGRSLAV